MTQQLLTLATEFARFSLQGRPETTDLEVFHQVFGKRDYSCVDEVRDVQLIVDCGANVGYTAAYLLSRYPTSRVVAIEPDPDNFEVLRRNLAPYGDSVKALRMAVWSHPTGLVLSKIPYRDGKEWARQVRECRPGEDPEVLGLDIGSILREVHGERISILKMDVEGAEGQIFGANYESWIDLVDNIVIELHDDSMFGNCSAIFMNAISGRGFSITHHGELTLCTRG